MDRHTESFICLSLFVILLQNTARSEECSHSYTEAPGNISDLFDTNHHTYTCKYHVYAPPGHYIRLNVTGLLGSPLVDDCLPRVVIKNIDIDRNPTNLGRICQGVILPYVVQSLDRELKIVFKGLDQQTSSFNASFTFHRKPGPSSVECLQCARATKQQATQLAATASNASVMSTAGNRSTVHPNGQYTEPPKPDPPTHVARRMELFVLIILAPVTLVCICCVIMSYRRKNATSTHQQTPRLPSDTSPPASHAPLLSPHSGHLPSSIYHQESLRQQRETIFRRSESTEKFPSSVELPDEDEPSNMRHNVVLNRDICGDNSIRPPRNRTVSEIYENALSERSRQQHLESPRVSPQMSVPRNPLLRTDSARSGGTSRNILVDSVTRNPLQFGDSDSEGPPPYTSDTTSIPSNTGNVCDPQHFVSNSAAAAVAGHQVRHHGRGAHPQHANGRHPPVPLSPHFELDADQGGQSRSGTVDRLNRMERSDHETTDVL